MTINVLMLLGYLVLPICTDGQFFKVETVSEVDSWMESVIPDKEPPFYKIKLKNDQSELGMIVYPPYSEKDFTGDEQLAMIEELLGFEGDTRKCFMRIKCSDNASYKGGGSVYSIQMEALYIINSLFFENYADYSPCPILTDGSGNTATIDGAMLATAYTAYKKWFLEVKTLGFAAARAKKLDPLAGATVKWFK